MAESCRRAAEMGLSGIAFTEHADLTDWTIPAGASVDPDLEPYLSGQTVKPPGLDVEGYLGAVTECRLGFPELKILTGVEISEPHWHATEVAALLARGRFDRVLSSVHAGRVPGGACEVSTLFGERPARDVVCDYLVEVTDMIRGSDVQVLAHIDYAARYWPEAAGPHDVREFEAEYRHALEALAEREGALEINTRIPLDPQLVAWWVEADGRAVTFGSDSHTPDTLGRGLLNAAKLAASLGFAPSADPAASWQLA